jgi:hypothetical protein
VNKSLYNGTSETEVNINLNVNNGSEKLYEKTVTFGKLIIAVYISVG